MPIKKTLDYRIVDLKNNNNIDWNYRLDLNDIKRSETAYSLIDFVVNTNCSSASTIATDLGVSIWCDSLSELQKVIKILETEL